MKNSVSCLCVCSVLVAAVALTVDGSTQDRVAAAKAALGGEKALSAVRTFRMAGKRLTRNQRLAPGALAGDEFISSPIAIVADLPGRYFQTLDVVFGSMFRRFESGFNGDRSLNRTVGSPVSPSSPDALRTQQTELAKLVLLMFLRTDTALPLTRQTNADGGNPTWSTPAGDAFVMSFDPKSSLPLRVTFQVAMRNPDGTRSDDRVEHSLEVKERRVVSGLNLPSRTWLIRRGQVVEETTFETMEINPVLPAETFRGGVTPAARR